MTYKTAISVDRVGKQYYRGVPEQQHNSLRDQIAAGIGSMLKPRKAAEDGSGHFWALKDASFEIGRGENVGIIGLNGAGKSTLLKILSRIVTPTEGSARIAGRLGALIEVGTGFHGELTGRENTFLYGAILGMSRREVERKFDAIVAFAEMGEFIDMPVKRYSSGMYVRLAFGVAAHLDPDILLLDEVLAVGDFAFQKKCMDVAHQLQRRDATILFVSHNMFTIKAMCQRSIYLRRGKVVFDGSTDEALKLYDEDCRLAAPHWYYQEVDTPQVTITDVTMTDSDGTPKTIFDFGDRVRMRVRYNAPKPVLRPNFLFSFARSDDLLCCNFSSSLDGVDIERLDGEGEIELLTPPLKLVPETYRLTVSVYEQEFGRIVGAQMGATFHVRHPILAPTAFGVFHESGEWRV